MKAKIKLVKTLGKAATPEDEAFIARLVELYSGLAQTLTDKGAGVDGEWYLMVERSPANKATQAYFTVELNSGLGAYQDTRVRIERRFAVRADGNKTLINDLLSIGEGLQKGGYADVVNAVGVEALEAYGGTRVYLHANLDVGGYAWLRKGVWPQGEAEDNVAFFNMRIRRAFEEGDVSKALMDKFLALTEGKTDEEAEIILRRFVLTDEFREYKDAFLRTNWRGGIDVSDPEARARFLGQKAPADPVAHTLTPNESLRDATLRHQIALRRYSAGVSRKVEALLLKADAELVERIRTRLARFEGKQMDFTGERWKALLTEVREERAAVMAAYRDTVRGEVVPLGRVEADHESGILEKALPIELQLAAVAPEQLRAIMTSKPFQGKLLNDWFKELESVDQRRLQTALQLGMVQGEPTDDIVRRIVGTRSKGFTDGILTMTRRDATAIARTAINHVSNNARSMVWDENEDIIQAKIWSSTLDGRTTAVCRARDGHGTPVGDSELPPGVRPLVPKGVHPPAHMNCRSTMVAYIDGIGMVGKRPMVVDTRTRAKREVDFRKMAKEQGKSIKDVRAEWGAEAVGRVPAGTTYQDFLQRQSPAFQDEVLGKAKGRLFRDGGLNVDQFVDRAGNEMTLSELAETHPDAFARAGVDLP